MEFLTPRYDLLVVALSVLIAGFASYVALDMGRRIRSQDGWLAMVWVSGGALVMGSGVWSMHFVGMLAFQLPLPMGYAPRETLLSWVAAVAVSGLALSIASRDRLSVPVLLGGSLAMGLGICAMHYTGMLALEMTPGIVWNWGLVAVSALIACVASGAALTIFFLMRRFKGAQARAFQLAAATVMGLAISGMHYTGMAAASFPTGSVCLSANSGLGGDSLGTLVVVATAVLLSIALFTTAIDARLQAKANLLSASLQQANHQLQGANAELQRLAFLDPLTGIPNRTLFEDRMGHAVARVDSARAEPGSRKLQRVGLLFIDLDGFKPVNDSDGHAAGDELLRQVARRLDALSRETDTVARVGGDEFVMLMDGISAVSDAVGLAGRVLQALDDPFQITERKVSLSCSIGVAVYPDHGSRDKLVAHADAAMYNAKRNGGGNYAVYETHMHEGVSDQLDLQQALREALAKGQLSLNYQPKVDGKTGQVRGVEALLRWHHPERGHISPAVFIPIAERFGMIVPIGNWVIQECCRQIAAWAAQGLNMRVSLNLSGYQLRQPDVVAQLQHGIDHYGVDPRLIVCEITESVAMEDTPTTRQVVEDLLAIGIKLSIDDFGTGYSSLASLRQLRTHEVKIDRSFVQDVATSADARAVVDAILHLARALKLKVVAEGVETREQRDVLVALGCDEMQGYYFARPMVASQLAAQELTTSDGAEAVGFSASAFIDFLPDSPQPAGG